MVRKDQNPLDKLWDRFSPRLANWIVRTKNRLDDWNAKRTARKATPSIVPPMIPPPTPDASIPAPSVSLPFLITGRMRRQLSRLGYTEEQIASLTPERANEILAQRTPANVVTPPLRASAPSEAAPPPTPPVSPTPPVTPRVVTQASQPVELPLTSPSPAVRQIRLKKGQRNTIRIICGAAALATILLGWWVWRSIPSVSIGRPAISLFPIWLFLGVVALIAYSFLQKRMPPALMWILGFFLPILLWMVSTTFPVWMENWQNSPGFWVTVLALVAFFVTMMPIFYRRKDIKALRWAIAALVLLYFIVGPKGPSSIKTSGISEAKVPVGISAKGTTTLNSTTLEPGKPLEVAIERCQKLETWYDTGKVIESDKYFRGEVAYRAYNLREGVKSAVVQTHISRDTIPACRQAS